VTVSTIVFVIVMTETMAVTPGQVGSVEFVAAAEDMEYIGIELPVVVMLPRKVVVPEVVSDVCSRAPEDQVLVFVFVCLVLV